MTITVIKGGSPLTADEKKKIIDIFKESKNPNESLINTFASFKSFDGNTLHLDDGTGDDYAYPEEIDI
ncbi:hypothetical protein [Pectinatus frisingensis]|uniref:hypothetical protein n=1 Tax=Pectinatus frisingensis TaxID=865 RepID=UPI0018C80BE5|nr:hypothetical protein [Pectinatus frisingensis]